MKIIPMTKKQAKDFHGEEVWNRTNSVLCSHCYQSNFFHGNDFPAEFYCANCGEKNKKSKQKITSPTARPGRARRRKMLTTTQWEIYGKENYNIYINGVFFGSFDSSEYGDMLARAISLALFHTLPD